MTKTEIRRSVADLEVRAEVREIELRAEDDGNRTLLGYASVFDTPADIGGMFREQVAAGAFKGTIKDGDIRALFDHDPGRVLGRTKNKTMRLKEDDHGLRVEIDLPDTQDGRDVATLVDRGDISGMSIGFRALKQEWDDTEDPPLRTLTEIELFEASVVTFPAFDETEVALRALNVFREIIRQESTPDANDAADALNAAEPEPESEPEVELEPSVAPVIRTRMKMRQGFHDRQINHRD